MRIWRVQDGDPTEGEVLGAVAAEIVRGRLVAVPTETYYGVAADSRRPEALARVQSAKGRGRDKPLLLLVAGLEQARALSPQCDARLEQLTSRYWPGPLTLVVPARPGLPASVVSNAGGVAVRQSPCPILRRLLARVGAPVSGTSANRTGAPPAQRATEIDLPDLDGILDGGTTPGGPPSTLLDLTRNPARVLRAGAVDVESLTETLSGRLL